MRKWVQRSQGQEAELRLAPKPALLAAQQGGSGVEVAGRRPAVLTAAIPVLGGADKEASSCLLCWASPLAFLLRGPAHPPRSGPHRPARTRVSIPGPHSECSGPLHHHLGEPSAVSGAVGTPGRGPDLHPAPRSPRQAGARGGGGCPASSEAVAPTTASEHPEHPLLHQQHGVAPSQPCKAQRERLSSHQLGATGTWTPEPQPLHLTKDEPCPLHPPLLPPSQRPAASGSTSSERLGVPPTPPQ